MNHSGILITLSHVRKAQAQLGTPVSSPRKTTLGRTPGRQPVGFPKLQWGDQVTARPLRYSRRSRRSALGVGSELTGISSNGALEGSLTVTRPRAFAAAHRPSAAAACECLWQRWGFHKPQHRMAKSPIHVCTHPPSHLAGPSSSALGTGTSQMGSRHPSHGESPDSRQCHAVRPGL